MLSDQQIQERRPLWAALSELWLDTELTAEDLEHIARVMADSGLSLEELRHVHLDEVAPVVSINLLSVAGAWAGFDEEWLCSRIVRNLRERPLRTKFWARFPITRWWRASANAEHWATLVERVQRLRQGPG
jgi:hypothetical protein